MTETTTTTSISADRNPTESEPTFVVGYSPKPEGQAALSRGLTEAQLHRAHLIVVHLAPVPDSDLVSAQLTANGISFEIKEVAESLDPAEELIKCAEQVSAELIVIGLRRRSPVGKLLLGSNAQRVLLDASCPVLAVKADES